MAASLALVALLGMCQDDPAWDNHSGKSCADYAASWCTGSGFKEGKQWTGGLQFNYPEKHCCACGKPPEISPPPPPATAFSFLKPLFSTSGAADPAAPGASPSTPVDDLAAALQARLNSCAAPTSRASEKTMLYFARLPRTGSALMCQILGACSARMVHGACGDAPAAGAGSCRANALGYSYYGSEKLPQANYAMCSGADGRTPACSSFGGDFASGCQHMATLKSPSAVMVATERWPDWSIGPCPGLEPSVKMMVLLRDPGERAQSAFNFHLENCVCNFRFQWCTMFSSFRFSQRKVKLCNEHTPAHGFAAALSAMRSHGNLPWPVTSTETPHLLGRYTASVVRDVYTPFFGSYKVGGSDTLKASPALAKKTLANCVAWVGIAEDLALSLQLLKLELPSFFGKLDVAAFQWSPTSGATRPGGDPSAANQSQHPYLRSHLLPNDYEVYDAERARLFERARNAGIAVYGAPPYKP